MYKEIDNKDLDVGFMGEKTMKCHFWSCERRWNIYDQVRNIQKKHTTNVDFEKKKDKKKNGIHTLLYK